MMISAKLFCSFVAASLCLQGLSKPTDEPPSMIDVDFYKPTEQDIAEIHKKVILSLNKTEESPPPPPILPKPVYLVNASASHLSEARTLVDEAIKQQGEYNLWRMANPRRGDGPSAGQKRMDTGEQQSPPQLTPELLNALKLANDVDTQDLHNNGTLQKYQDDAEIRAQDLRPDVGSSAGEAASKRDNKWDGTDWMAEQDHSLSQQPFHSEKGYKVWRNVKDYGAVGDGVTDDTEAIQKAISDGNRCGKDCPESSVSGAIVFFPSGTYRVDRSIVLYYNTQLMGGVAGPGPIIQSARNFIGLGVFTTDVYLADGHSEWYLNTSNFYRSIRGLLIDTRLTRQKGMVGIHWQVAQATTIEETGVMMSNATTTTQVGIFAENGSGGWMGDLTISDGEYGILAGSQQYSASRITIIGSQKCIGMIWNWVWSWSHLRLESCRVAFDLTATGSSSTAPVGSLSVVDSEIIHCGTAIKTYPFTLTQPKEQGSSIITFSHTRIYKSTTFISFPDGTSISSNLADALIDYWQYGNDFKQGDVAPGNSTPSETRPANLLDANGNWFSTGKPIFYNRNKGQVVNARIHAAGDGKTDDTVALQSLFQYAAENNLLLYIPAGVYIISSPLLIPPNTLIRGEVWSQLMAVGDKFSDASHPRAMITVGQGEKNAVVQMENLIFTSRGALPGLVLLQWNLQSTKQGDVGLWDCHFRVGGATGTDLRKANCPKLSGSVDSKCVAGAVMLVKTDKGGGYFENMWAWVADHDLDDPAGDDSNQINVYFGRGVLIYGDAPTWWRGTASEHSALYQYNIVKASNIYMSIIQTESPYYQGTSFLQAPAPFKVDNWIGEPTFDTCGDVTTNCNVAWALIIQKSDGIYIDGAGLYSWFQNYKQDCVGKKNCQQRLVNVYHSANVFLSHLITIGSIEVVTPAISNRYNRIIYADDTLEATGYPWWTAVASYLDSNDKVDVSQEPYPVQHGWVSFGDSYAAGIGAGNPYDSIAACKRGTGSYTAILNQIIRLSHQGDPVWQPLSCSGETASQFVKGQGIDQLTNWYPGTSDIATVSFTGNDLGFGNIVSHCIMGYPRGSWKDTCENDIRRAENILEGDSIDDLIYDVLDKIFAKTESLHRRFVVYWTGYPQFFAVSDNTCDSSYFVEGIWSGNYLKMPLRLRLNDLSIKLNEKLRYAIRRYDGGRPYPRAKFVDIDALPNIYNGHRFCEPGVKETLKSHDGQNTVAFFYDNGYDDIPSNTEGFNLPAPVPGAPGGWSTSVTSSTCSEVMDPNEPLGAMLCSYAKDIANGTIAITEFQGSGGSGPDQAVRNSDGSVTITDWATRFEKMFHPKTRANWHIAQAVNDALIMN